jgi:hypothetical protein
MDITLVKDEIHSASGALRLGIVQVDGERARGIRDALTIKYGADSRFEFADNNIRPEHRSSVQHPDSWSWVDEFLTDEPVLFFYDSNLNGDDAMFRIPSGRDVVTLLRECSSFPFYVTNDALDYVICHNDHDYIVGAGRAKAWVESLTPRHEEWAQSLRKSK